jgi:hypothetical protein
MFVSITAYDTRVSFSLFLDMYAIKIDYCVRLIDKNQGKKDKRKVNIYDLFIDQQV